VAEERDFRQTTASPVGVSGCNVVSDWDSDPTQPPPTVANAAFNIEIPQGNRPYACAFKPNAAFYEATMDGRDEDERADVHAHFSTTRKFLIYDAGRGRQWQSPTSACPGYLMIAWGLTCRDRASVPGKKCALTPSSRAPRKASSFWHTRPIRARRISSPGSGTGAPEQRDEKRGR